MAVLSDDADSPLLPTFSDATGLPGYANDPGAQASAHVRAPATTQTLAPLSNYWRADQDNESGRERDRTAYGQAVPQTWRSRTGRVFGSAAGFVWRHVKRGGQGLLKTAGYYRRKMFGNIPGHKRWHVNALLASGAFTLEWFCEYVLETEDPTDLFRPDVDLRLAGAYIDPANEHTLAMDTLAPFRRLSNENLDYFFRLRPNFEHVHTYGGLQTFLQMLQAGMRPGHFAVLGVSFTKLIVPPSSMGTAPLVTIDVLRECTMHSDSSSPVRTIARRWNVRDWVVGMHMSVTDLIRLKELCPTEDLVGPQAYLETFGLHPAQLAAGFGLYRPGQAIEDLSASQRRLLLAAGLVWDQADARPRKSSG